MYGLSRNRFELLVLGQLRIEANALAVLVLNNDGLHNAVRVRTVPRIAGRVAVLEESMGILTAYIEDLTVAFDRPKPVEDLVIIGGRLEPSGVVASRMAVVE